MARRYRKDDSADDTEADESECAERLAVPEEAVAVQRLDDCGDHAENDRNTDQQNCSGSAAHALLPCRSHTDACAGCMTSPTTWTRSVLSISRSTWSRSRAEK